LMVKLFRMHVKTDLKNVMRWYGLDLSGSG
jgi:hypothetical protein